MAGSATSTRFWDRIAERYDENTSESLEAYYDTRLAHMLELLGRDDRVLDFACGTGRLALDLAPHVDDVLAIDLSRGMIAQAQRKLPEDAPANVQFMWMDVFDTALDTRRFDAATAFNVIHLLDDPGRYLRRLRELLTPRGLLIAETPCLGRHPSFKRTAIRVLGRTPLLPRARILKPETIERLVAEAGFEIVESRLLAEEVGDPWLVARRAQ